jgi:RNA polymerase sigma-70 factor (ECF subfamily)
VVLLAGREEEPRSAEALDRLCRTYWFPIYAFVRRRGFAPHDAQDLVQEFFSDLLRRRFLDRVSPSSGRFRSFLLASLGNFLANQYDREQCQKRGGGCQIFSLDAQPAEERYQLEPAHEATPEKLFEQRWAQTVLEQVVSRIQSEFAANQQTNRFDYFKEFLLGDPPGLSYSEVAARLNLSVSALTSAIHRTRVRFREVFRAEIAQTVAAPSEIDDEIRHLVAALNS